MAHKLVALFVRHGSTELNDAGKFRGPLDPDLDDNGRDQAKEVRKQLKGYKFGRAYTSNKKRSQQTADIVLQDLEGRLSKPVEDLAPLNVGEFAGQPKNDENMEKIKYYQDNPDEPIPGGESINDFRSRVNPQLKKIIKQGASGNKPSIAFVHSSTIHQLGHMLHDDHNHVKVKPGGIAGVFKGPYGFYAKALTKQSTDKKDQHMVS